MNKGIEVNVWVNFQDDDTDGTFAAPGSENGSQDVEMNLLGMLIAIEIHKCHIP